MDCRRGRRGVVTWAALCCGLLALLLAPGPAAAEPEFDARGSVEQVYATGLPPGAQVSLYDSAARKSRPKNAERPRRRPLPRSGAGRRLPRRPDDRRAGIAAAAGPDDPVGAAQHRHLQPVDPVERLRVPDHPRRHQAGDRRPPAAGRDARPARGRTAAAAERPDADPDRVLGLRVRRTRPGPKAGSRSSPT